MKKKLVDSLTDLTNKQLLKVIDINAVLMNIKVSKQFIKDNVEKFSCAKVTIIYKFQTHLTFSDIIEILGDDNKLIDYEMFEVIKTRNYIDDDILSYLKSVRLEIIDGYFDYLVKCDIKSFKLLFDLYCELYSNIIDHVTRRLGYYLFTEDKLVYIFQKLDKYKYMVMYSLCTYMFERKFAAYYLKYIDRQIIYEESATQHVYGKTNTISQIFAIDKSLIDVKGCLEYNLMASGGDKNIIPLVNYFKELYPDKLISYTGESFYPIEKMKKNFMYKDIIDWSSIPISILEEIKDRPDTLDIYLTINYL